MESKTVDNLGSKLSKQQKDILRFIAEKGGTIFWKDRPRNDTSRVYHASISRSLKRLEQRGLIRRAMKQGRTYLVSLTEAGKKVQESQE